MSDDEDTGPKELKKNKLCKGFALDKTSFPSICFNISRVEELEYISSPVNRGVRKSTYYGGRHDGQVSLEYISSPVNRGVRKSTYYGGRHHDVKYPWVKLKKPNSIIRYLMMNQRKNLIQGKGSFPILNFSRYVTSPVTVTEENLLLYFHSVFPVDVIPETSE